jgi:hypothetical protein
VSVLVVLEVEVEVAFMLSKVDDGEEIIFRDDVNEEMLAVHCCQQQLLQII